ncbi:hypothetical protein KCU77_g5078, partial [Aureobasidium melanogenum]
MPYMDSTRYAQESQAAEQNLDKTPDETMDEHSDDSSDKSSNELSDDFQALINLQEKFLRTLSMDRSKPPS